MDRRLFRRLVGAGFIKSFTLSIAAMVDCAVVGRYLGADGLSSMKLAMPVFSILSLFSSILSTGLSVAVSRELTRGDREKAGGMARTVLTFSVIIAAVNMLVGMLCPSVITVMLAGNDISPGVFASATDYIAPILFAALPILLYDILGTLAMLEGAVRHMQCASAALLVVDIIGNYVAVRLNAGLFGIAVASGAAYLCAFLIVAAFFFGKRTMFRPRLCKPDFAALGRVVVLGLPMAVKGLCGILWPLSVNRLMLKYGTMSGIAALSIQDAVHYLPAALCSGIANATLIMAGIYAGEQDSEGLRKVNRSIVRWSLIAGSAIAVVLGLAAEPILRLFSDDGQIVSLSVSALRLYLIGVPFLALNFAAAAYLQAVGRNRDSGVVIFVNHIFLSILSAVILARFFGTKGIFASYGICEIVMSLLLLVSVLVFLQKIRQKSTVWQQDKKTELRRSIKTVDEAVSASMQVRDFCLASGIQGKEAFYIALCTEELAVNSIEHGFNDGKEHHLELRAVISRDVLLLRLRDDCRRFDLVERYKIIRPDDPAKNIGLRIVFSKADDVSYSSALNLNNVCVKYAIRS